MHLTTKLRRRLASDEGGFTLIELLVVLVIIGILLAIAVPSYLGFRDRANQSAAQSNLRAAVPSVETYYSDNNTYVGMTTTALKAIDAGLGSGIAIGTVSSSTYCVQATVGGHTYKKAGPAASITSGACP
jgi:type IV pilus assembly protein PilA